MKFELQNGITHVFYELQQLEDVVASTKVMFLEAMQENAKLRELLAQGKIDQSVEYLQIYTYYTQSAKRNGSHPLFRRMLGELSTPWTVNRQSQPVFQIDRVAERLNDADEEWTLLIKKNDEFIKHARKDTFKPPDYLTWIAPSSKAKEYSINVVYKNLKSECERCGEEVNPLQIPKHQKTLKCFQKSKLEDAKSRGFVSTRDQRLARIVRSGNVSGEWVPIKFDTYVPKWLISAAALYDKNEGFAGMEFEKFVLECAKNEQED